MENNAFEDIACTVEAHFRLNYYAAAYCLLHRVRSLSLLTGESLEKDFEKHPFLARYLEEILPYLPDDLDWDEGLAWWEEQLSAWEAQSTELPLTRLKGESGIGFRSRMALMLTGLVEEDSRFGTLFEEMQSPLCFRRPGLELVGRLASGISEQDGWSICRPLLANGLMEAANPDTPRSEWILRVPPLIWDALRGEAGGRGGEWCRHHPAEGFPPLDRLIFPGGFSAKLHNLPALLASGKARSLVLRGSTGSQPLQVMGAAARALGRGLAVVELASPSPEDAHRMRSLGPFCVLTDSIPVFSCRPGPGETITVPPTPPGSAGIPACSADGGSSARGSAPLLPGYRGPIGILMGREGGLDGPGAEQAVALTLPMPRAAERLRHWKEALGETPVCDLEEISRRFHLPGGYIRRAAEVAVAQAALDGCQAVEASHVRQACRLLNRQLLDTLAAPVTARGSWGELVAGPATSSRLAELERRCRHREELSERLGPAFAGSGSRGVRALFSGPSGTGKTLAARILASELGMDLYRVDLAAVVNKYIGETEKNLHKVLSRAEELDVVLLLDEGDALLGQRTEVKSANDRYANLETNYLLQRLESYQGIVLVTTNAGDNIDSAFQRRMDVVVPFVSPQALQRQRIWQLHLPQGHLVDDFYLEQASVRCALTGGQIRNAALHAALLALDEEEVVQVRHLEEAIRSEYRKAGAVCPLNNGNSLAGPRSGVNAFVDALSS